MKKLILSLIVFLLPAALSADDAFTHYVNKDYQKAYDSLYSLFSSDSDDPLYSYNLGVVSSKLGKKGESLYFYLQSLQNSPDFSEARNNLEIVSKDLGVTVPKKLLEPLYAVDITLILFFISLYAFAVLLSILCFKNDWRIKITLLPVFLFTCVTASLYYFNYTEQAKETWAVVVAAEPLRSGPDSSLNEIGSVKEGEVINILYSSGSWYKVKSFQDNVEGWIDLKTIRALKRGHI